MGAIRSMRAEAFILLAGGVWMVGPACSSDSNLAGRPVQSSPSGSTSDAHPDQPVPAGPSPRPNDSANADAVVRASQLSISETFDVSRRRDASLKYDFKERIFSEDLQLTSIYEERSKEFQQIKRPKESKLFSQGSLGTTRTDRLSQANLGILDIQVVVDNSNSMKEEQANLATKLAPLIREIEQSDWRINIVTTDPAQITTNVCSRALVRRGDANGTSVFSTGVSAGTAGSGNEQGFRLAVHGLSCQTTPWVRPNSSVAVLIISDEDNCSDRGSDCPNTAYAKPEYLLNYLTGSGRTLNKDARVYGLIKIPGSTNCTTAPTFGTYYQAAITASGGRSGSICDADYSGFLAAMSKDLVTLLKAEFTLSDTPNAGSLKIYVNNVLQPSDSYQLMGKSVRFMAGKLPPAGASIVAEYRLGVATPVLSRFPLGEAPLPGTTEVLINGAMADPASYIIDARTNEVVFKVPPPERADIKISFTKNVPLLSSFSLDGAIVGLPSFVSVNKAETKNYKILSGGTIEFGEAPADGADIVIKYKANAGPKVEYVLAAGGAATTVTGIYDRTAGDKIEYTQAGAKVTLKPTDVRDGRMLVVRFRSEASHVQQVEVTSTPLEGSLAVRPSAGECSHSLEGMILTLNCNVPDGTSVAITWSYTENTGSFVLEGVVHPEDGMWRVEVNGMETTAYSRQGSTITLNDMPQADAKVTVTFAHHDPKAE